MAKTLAKALGYDYVDTGAMYRAVTLYAMRHSLIDAEGVADSQAIAEALPKIGIAFRRETDGSQHTPPNGEDVEPHKYKTSLQIYRSLYRMKLFQLRF